MGIRVTQNTATPKLEKLLSNLGEYGQDVLQVWAEETKDYLVNAIEMQKYNHVPLSERWLAYKKATGLDDRILIATNEYISGFYITNDGKTATLQPKKEHEQLATWLEYGTQKMPARPHWKFAAAWAGKQWIKILKTFDEAFFQGVS